MSPTRACAVAFLLLMGITLVVPSFPPAQLLHEYLNIPQSPLGVWAVSVQTVLKSLTNGSLGIIITAAVYILFQRAKKRKVHALPPMPIPPQLSTPPLESTLTRELYWGTNTISPSKTEETKLPRMENDSEKSISTVSQIQDSAQIDKRPQIEKPRSNQRIEQFSQKANSCPHNIGYFSQPDKYKEIPLTCIKCEHLISCATRTNK